MAKRPTITVAEAREALRKAGTLHVGERGRLSAEARKAAEELTGARIV